MSRPTSPDIPRDREPTLVLLDVDVAHIDAALEHAADCLGSQRGLGGKHLEAVRDALALPADADEIRPD